MVFLSYLLKIHYINNNNFNNLYIVGENFENEIEYIKNNFGVSYINNYTILFEDYVKDIGYNFTFICYSYYYFQNISQCNGNNVDCCYYYNNSYVLLPNGYILYYYEDLVCFMYNISSENNSFSNFFCT